MANKPISMTTLKVIIQGLAKGDSRNFLSQCYHVSRNTIREYERKIQSLQMSYEELLKLPDKKIYDLLQYHEEVTLQDSERYRRLESMMPYLKQELSKCGVTRYLLWEEYLEKEEEGYSYSQFCEHLKQYIGRHDISMKLTHLYGDCMEVDFAGKKMQYVDFKTGKAIEVPVLICILPASGYPYVEALSNGGQEQVYGSLSRSLCYFGGVPRNILSDNMKQYVEKASRYEPKFNELAQEWASHYGTNLMATRVRKPKDKASVENMVHQVYVHVFAPMRNRVFTSLYELNEALLKQLEIFSRHPFQRREGNRYEEYLKEKHFLQPLREDDFIYKHKVEVKVQKNYHILLGEDVHFYSVPYQYVGKQVSVIYDTKEVAIYQNINQIAVHQRDNHRNGYSTYKEHMPQGHQKYYEQKGWDAEYFLRAMSDIGESALKVTSRILEMRNFPEQSYRACCGLISLCKHYGKDRFNNACKRALTGSRITYATIENILKKNLDLQENLDFPSHPIPNHQNIRGNIFYL